MRIRKKVFTVIYLDVPTALGVKNEQRIDTLEAATDVADIVGTYAELEAYDTSKLTDQAVVKVLADYTHSNAQAYYRYTKSTDTFVFIGSIGPYVDLTTTASKVYATNGSGQQTTLTYSTTASASTIVQRTSGQQVRVATTPSGNNDATSKKYVDDGLSGKVDHFVTTVYDQASISVTLTHNNIFNCTTNLTNLILVLPNTIPVDYNCQLNFTAGADLDEHITIPNTIIVHGEDVNIETVSADGDVTFIGSGTFVPTFERRYAMRFFSDGVNVHCEVYGD